MTILQSSIKVLFAFCLATFSIHLSAMTMVVIDDFEWDLKKTTGDIKVFSAKVPQSSHKAVLATTVINHDIDTIVELMRNPETCSQWVYRCKSSRRVASINDQEDYIYTVTSLPFPLQKRDIVAHIKWDQNSETQVVTSIGVAIESAIPQQETVARIKAAVMVWELTPLNNQQTAIRSFAHVDPAGAIPSWLSNSVSVEGPVKTLQGLKELLDQQ